MDAQNAEPKSFKFKKIVILSGGAIGVETAKELAEQDIRADEIVVFNRINPDSNLKTQAALRGIKQAFWARNLKATRIRFSTDEREAITGADLAVVVAGAKREGNETRDDVLFKNMPVIDKIGQDLKNYYTGETVLSVPNPMDKLALRLQQVTGFEPGRIVGVGGVLDETRLIDSIIEILGDKIQHNRENIRNTAVVGEHGDNMVAVLSQVEVKINGEWKALSTVCNQIDMSRIEARTADAIRDEDGIRTTAQLLKIKDGEAGSLPTHQQLIRKTGLGGKRFIDETGSSDFYGPAGAIVRMVDALIQARSTGKSDPLACSCYDADNEIFIGKIGTFDAQGKFSAPPEMQPALKLRQESETMENAISELRRSAQSFPPLPHPLIGNHQTPRAVVAL